MMLLKQSAVAIGLLVMASALSAASLKQQFDLHPGDEVPPLTGLDELGRAIEVRYETSKVPTVLYVITPFGCWVERNDRNFATLVTSKQTSFRFVLLAPNRSANARLGEYLAKERPKWGSTKVAVVKDVPDQVKRDYFLGAYPSTLVVSPNARVVRNFQGAYTDVSRSAKPVDIMSFFGIKSLPGLSGNESC
jgi:hypothetical protein